MQMLLMHGVSRIDMHGAELEAMKAGAQVANAFLLEKRGTG